MNISREDPISQESNKTTLNTIDKQMLLLITILKGNGTIRFDKDFCEAIGLVRHNLPNIRNGRNRFTVDHIARAVKVYNVNPNWIFGSETDVFKDTEKYTIDNKNNK